MSEGSFCPIVTLPPLQKNFVNFFSVFAGEFCIEKWRGFLVKFFWSPFPTKRSTKNLQKIRGKFGEKFGAKSGTNIQKIRGTFVLRLFSRNRLVHLAADAAHGFVVGREEVAQLVEAHMEAQHATHELSDANARRVSLKLGWVRQPQDLSGLHT